MLQVFLDFNQQECLLGDRGPLVTVTDGVSAHCAARGWRLDSTLCMCQGSVRAVCVWLLWFVSERMQQGSASCAWFRLLLAVVLPFVVLCWNTGSCELSVSVLSATCCVHEKAEAVAASILVLAVVCK